MPRLSTRPPPEGPEPEPLVELGDSLQTEARRALVSTMDHPGALRAFREGAQARESGDMSVLSPESLRILMQLAAMAISF